MIKKIKFKTIEEYIKKVNELTINIDEVETHQLTTYWFRGHSNTEWDLIPKLFRQDFIGDYDIDDIETALINDFIMNYILHDKTETKRWDTLIKMQHYGIPTRILDWSESALVALFFAIEKWSCGNTRPCVWIIDPRKLNEVMIGEHALFFSEGSTYNNWLPETINAFYEKTNKLKFKKLYRKKVGKVPIALNYKHVDSRSVNQKGTAVVFPTESKKLQAYRNLGLIKLELDCSDFKSIEIKKLLVAQLDILGINSSVAYPDLQGLNTYLTWKHTGKI